MEQTVQYFNLSKKTPKNANKVWKIESVYDDMLPKFLHKICSRCKCDKHISLYGKHTKTGEPLKCCEPCTEQVKQWKKNLKK